MPKLRLIAPFILIFALSAACAKETKQEVIRAVTGNDYIPLNFIEPESGEAVGWEYDAVNEIGRRLDIPVEWSAISWDAMIESVREGQFDVGMDGISITEKRKEQVDFSLPYMRSEQYMLVRFDEDRFDDVASFRADPDLLIGAQPGNTNFYTAAKEIFDNDENNPRIRLFDNFGLLAQALLNGDVDVTLMDAASARGYIGANAEQLKIVGEPLGSEDFGFIFPKDSPLKVQFDQIITELKEEGFFDELNQKWFVEYNK